MPAAYVRHDDFIDGFGASGFSISIGSAVGSGNTLNVAVTSDSYAEGGIPLTLTDNQGNTYTLVRTFKNPADLDVGLFRCHNITNAPTSLVFNWTGGGSRYVVCSILETSGLADAAETDSDHVRDIFVTTTTRTLTTIATGEALIGLVLNAPADFTPSAGLTAYPATGGGTVWLFDDDAGAAGNKTVGGSWAAGATAPLVAASYGVAGGGGGGTATQLIVQSQPANTVVGATMAPVQVRIADAGGVTVGTATNNVTVALLTGAGTLLGTLTVAAVAGVATFSNLSNNTLNTGAVLRFTSSGLTQVDSTAFDFTTGTGGGSATYDPLGIEGIPMQQLGDFLPGDSIPFFFNTVDPATRLPVTLAGTPSVSVFKDGSSTPQTTGVTLTVDFAGITGLHRVVVDSSSSATIYNFGADFVVRIATGTAGGLSLVGRGLASFSIGRRAAENGILYAGVLAAVTATTVTLPGAADFPTNSLAGATIVLPVVGSRGRIASNNQGTDVLTLTAAGWPGGVTPTGTPRFVLYGTPADDAVLDAAGFRAALGMSSANMDVQFTSVMSRLGAPTGASISADVASIKSDSVAILDDTGSSGVVVANASKTGYVLASTQTFTLNGTINGNLNGNVLGSVNSVVTNVTANDLVNKTNMSLSDASMDALLDRAVTEPTSAPTWPMSLRKMIQWLMALSVNKQIVTAGNNRLRNYADTTDIAAAAQSDDGTTYTKNRW